MNKIWTCDTVAATKNGAKAWMRAQPNVPENVVSAVELLVDALPENRPDQTIKVHTSGLLGDWSDYDAAKRPKPLGYFNLWVGYGNQPAVVS